MSDTDNHCLFFDAKGNGPSGVRLINRDVREERNRSGEVVVPRAFGMCWEVANGDLRFVEDGGFYLEATNVDWLIAKLTAWRDAPRLEARKTPTVAHGGGTAFATYDEPLPEEDPPTVYDLIGSMEFRALTHWIEFVDHYKRRTFLRPRPTGFDILHPPDSPVDMLTVNGRWRVAFDELNAHAKLIPVLAAENEMWPAQDFRAGDHPSPELCFTGECDGCARARLARVGIDADAELAKLSDDVWRKISGTAPIDVAEAASIREWLSSWPLDADVVPAARVVLIRMLAMVDTIAEATAREQARLAARKTPTVVADRDGFRLLTTTSGEWGIADDEAIWWLSCEDEARHEFRDATGTVSCEACARFIDRDDAAVDSEGIYTCDDEAACGAAYDAKEQSK